jgi:aminopeptidase N
VMRQLEAQTGVAGFQTGVRRYLQRYAYANAAWADLVAIMGGRRLTAWNDAWVRRAGRPHVKMKMSDGKLSVRSEDPLGAGQVWPQKFTVVAGGKTIAVNIAGAAAEVAAPRAPEWILTDARQPGYGYFEFDEQTLEFLRNSLEKLPDAGVRAVAWVNLRENLFEKRLQPGEFLDIALRALPKETEELTADFVLAATRSVYWALIPRLEREQIAGRMENLCWEQAGNEALPLTTRMAYFKTFRDVFSTENGWERLYEIWSGKRRVQGLVFSEADEMEMAYALALRKPKAAGGIAQQELERIKDPERRQEFEFVMAAAKGDDGERDAIFASLGKPENRKNEPWVLDALAFLHHPLHGAHGEKYIVSALEMLPEIKRTGSIFFPLNRLTANLHYHITPPARDAVKQFLRTHADLNPGLKQKVLQAADTILRFAP